jgi:hypothetical protein
MRAYPFSVDQPDQEIRKLVNIGSTKPHCEIIGNENLLEQAAKV